MVKERSDDIIKAKNDSRNYRVIRCNNDLVAALVSDPDTDKAAVALTVQVGSASDPEDVQGLAHFLEHMLFLGTEKFPVENDYKKFLLERGGAANASTSLDKTTYHLTVSPEHLSGALDRFSQFFISPLLSQAAAEREVNAVSMECERNRKLDHRRLMRLERWLSKVGHPYRKFSTGNRKLLDADPRLKGINVRHELLAFHDWWYSSNIMKVAVIGRESLNELENKMEVFFSDVPNRGVEPYVFSEHPYQKNETGILYYTVPVKNHRSLTLMFPCPDHLDRYKSSPHTYLKYIFESCCPGSIYSLFRGNFWIDSKIDAGLNSIMKGFGKFYVKLKLTEEGLLHYEEMVYSIFQYINMMKDEGPQQWIFDERALMANVEFQYQEKPLPQALVVNLAERLTKVPFEDILVSNHKLTEWDPYLITDILSCLRPDNLRIRLVSKKYESIVKDEEPIFGVKYRIEKIRPVLMEKWSDGSKNSEFSLPNVNSMIPTDFALVPPEHAYSVKPSIVYESKISRLWYMSDGEYRLPKIFSVYNFYIPGSYISPLASNLTFILLCVLEEKLVEKSWVACMSGASFKLERTWFGFRYSMSGYSQKYLEFTGHFLKAIGELKFDAQDLIVRKEMLQRHLNNKELDTPPVQSEYILRQIIYENQWTTEELIHAIDNISVPIIEAFYIRTFMHFFVESLVYGNISKRGAEDLWVRIRNEFPLIRFDISANQIRDEREVMLPLGKNYLYQKNEGTHTSSCTSVYYQLGTYTLELAAVAELFHQFVKEPIFTVLRTKEQLAYSVFRGVEPTNSCLVFYILLVTEKHPRYVDDRIEKLLSVLGCALEVLTDEEFEVHKQSLISILEVRSKKMSQKCDEIWKEIGRRQYCFDRKTRKISIIKTLNKSHLLDFYKNYVHPQGQRRRKLSIFVLSVAGNGSPTYVESSDSSVYEEITDPMRFKNSCLTYPLIYQLDPQCVL